MPSQEKIINEDIPEFLRTWVKMWGTAPYRVIGGMAIKAWLSSSYEGLSEDEKMHLKTSDWDIIVEGTKNDALELTNFLKDSLKRKHGDYFEARLDDTLLLNERGDDNIYIYQVGIIDEENERVEPLIDVHAEEELIGDENKVLSAEDGVFYSNLKELIERTLEAVVSIKAIKRGTRIHLMKEALKDIKRFNKPLFNQICASCKREEDGLEKITGYKLDCKKLHTFCEGEGEEKLKRFMEELKKRREEKLRKIMEQDSDEE